MKKTGREKVIVHIDGDAFFASCEMALDPKLRGKPIVTGQERGIASSVSYEAKKLGVSRTMPIYQIRKLFPQVIVCSSHYEQYGMFAQRMYAIVRRYTPTVEEYSIDECFADITGLDQVHKKTYTEIGQAIQKDLLLELGISFSIGIAPTKVLAKVASKWQKPNGFTVISNKTINTFLKDLEIGKVWGIGPQTSAELRKLGVTTALAFIEKPKAFVETHLSTPYLETWNELQGISVHNVHTSHEKQKSIQSTRTFVPHSTNTEYLISELSNHVEKICARARAQGLLARSVYYFLKTKEFRYHRFEIPIDNPTASPQTIVEHIRNTFEKVYRPNFIYRATGVTLAGLIPDTIIQSDLFGASQVNFAWQKVFESVDILDKRFGSHTLILGSSLKASKVKKSRFLERGQKKAFLSKNSIPKKRLSIPFMGEVK